MEMLLPPRNRFFVVFFEAFEGRLVMHPEMNKSIMKMDNLERTRGYWRKFFNG